VKRQSLGEPVAGQAGQSTEAEAWSCQCRTVRSAGLSLRFFHPTSPHPTFSISSLAILTFYPSSFHPSFLKNLSCTHIAVAAAAAVRYCRWRFSRASISPFSLASSACALLQPEFSSSPGHLTIFASPSVHPKPSSAFDILRSRYVRPSLRSFPLPSRSSLEVAWQDCRNFSEAVERDNR
jgi:hypothetical protein